MSTVLPNLLNPGLMSKPLPKSEHVSRLTLSPKRLQQDLADGLAEAEFYTLERQWIEENRPRIRSACKDSPRPCAFLLCKYNLYLDVNPESGSLKLNFPDKDIDELEDTCALDVADRGFHTLEQVADLIGLTRERVRQIETRSLLECSTYEALEEHHPATNPNKILTPKKPKKLPILDNKPLNKEDNSEDSIKLDDVLGLDLPDSIYDW